jgi:hypothetical protein
MGTKTRLMASRVLAAVSPSRSVRALNQPVFIVGFNKSGKTLLKNILSAHPDIISYPSEANELWHPHLYPWHRSDLSVPPIWIDPYRFVERSLADWTPRHRMAIQARLGAYQKLSGKRVLLLDSAMIAFMLPSLMELFPSARFIHFYRDGRISSYVTARKEHPKILKHKAAYLKGGYYFENFNELLPKVATYWAATMAEIERFSAIASPNDPANLIELSYEQFCAAPVDSLHSIFDFLDIPIAQLKVDHLRDANQRYFDEIRSEIDLQLFQPIRPTLQGKDYLS